MASFRSVVIMPSGRKLSVIDFRLTGTVVRFLVALTVMAKEVMVMVGTAVYCIALANQIMQIEG